jgi:hypothetical protein
MPKRSAPDTAPGSAARATRRSTRYHDMVAKKAAGATKASSTKPSNQNSTTKVTKATKAAAAGPEEEDSSESEPEELARFTPQALDQPAKAVQRSLAKERGSRTSGSGGRVRGLMCRTACCLACCNSGRPSAG